jgi:hypothetical protein
MKAFHVLWKPDEDETIIKFSAEFNDLNETAQIDILQDAATELFAKSQEILTAFYRQDGLSSLTKE